MKPEFLKQNALRLAFSALLAAGGAVFFLSGAYRMISFEELVEHKDSLIDLARAHPAVAHSSFISVYLILGVFGLPGSTILNLTAGLLFGFGKGICLVTLASTIASSLAFFSFRYLFRGWVEPRVRERFPRLEEHLEQEGAYFVFAMRLFPVIPYSITNLVLALSPVSFLTYLGVTLLALMPRYLLYVFAGSHLGDVKNPNDLISPPMIAVLSALAILPWILKLAAPGLKRRFGKKPE
jgi:uncharacterized membrane protein YdjX (TVP38/TMEM64 family)